MYELNGTLGRATVVGYDANTMTARISPYTGGSIIDDVVCPFTRNDPQSGAYSITPPSIGSQCLYTEILGEVIIIAIMEIT